MQATANGITINYQLDGPDDAPVLVFSNSLATSLAMWNDQVDRLKDRFRILRYDNRGHGATPVTDGPYTIGLLAEDLLGLLDVLGIEKMSYCGLSKGGMIGQWLGINASHRLDKLVVSNTASYFPNKEMWRDRIGMATNDGIPAIAEASISRWFTPGYLERADTKPTVDFVRAFILETTKDGYLSSSVAIRDMDFRDELKQIDVPTLVIIGEKDPATIPEYGELIAASIPGAKTFVVPDAAHLSNIEQPDIYTKALVDFL
ncbi:MAG: 3-oxoadipate enol-lactonase [Rhodospirillaceae bacterium]|jgi:3-oxoadipate enol-lactonase|nr:3-oxoadipate enol-lactonase [Rhodospirillaceae bacterium]MBT5455602.1 3-oxoadipate enol-lactonase [Rhodospirillaceae bacterium]